MWKRIIHYILLIIPLGLLVLLFTQKSELQNYISKEMKSQTDANTGEMVYLSIDSNYNYTSNGKSYKTTFLEFGALGCAACKRMELVMEEIKSVYPENVNVVFLNILIPENQNKMKYFGVSAIPTQILLDSSGNEYYRHIGYISTSELAEHFLTQN